MVIFRKVFKCILLKLRFHCISSVLISRKELFDIYGNGWGLGSRYRSWGIFHEICNSYYCSLLWCPRLFFFYSSMNLFCLLKVLVIIYYFRSPEQKYIQHSVLPSFSICADDCVNVHVQQCLLLDTRISLTVIQAK